MDYRLSNGAKEFHIFKEGEKTPFEFNQCKKCKLIKGICPFKNTDIHILHPLGNEVATKVKSWREIKKEALALLDFIDKKKFEGHWEDAYAISHAQVSREPKSYFVLNKMKEKKFGGRVIINCRMIKSSVPSIFPEGCMSFMFREMKKVDRFAHITVVYWTPFLNLFLIPHRKKFKNIESFIVQHELQHARGENIYGI